VDLHIINGFLGSGKTTGIIAATKYLMGQCKLVGIITNDKGQFQVDRSFFESSAIPTRQVTGGCFRCSFSEFEDIIAELQDDAKPDVIFAEAVGSCVDLVNTIFDPLQSIEKLQVSKTTFSVFTDSRLFQIWINDEPLPFSEHINYLFEKQMEEGHILIINKADLLTADERDQLLRQAEKKFPQKSVFLQNSKEPNSVLPWIEVLKAKDSEPKSPDFSVDYPRYKAGEQEMAWLDQKLTFRSPDPEQIKAALTAIVDRLLSELQEGNVFVAHIKLLITSETQQSKISFTTADFFAKPMDRAWVDAIPDVSSDKLEVMLNARLSVDAQLFYDEVRWIVNQVTQAMNVVVDFKDGSAYNPVMSMSRP